LFKKCGIRIELSDDEKKVMEKVNVKKEELAEEKKSYRTKNRKK